MLNPKQIRNFQRILPFGVSWTFFAGLYFLIERGVLANNRFDSVRLDIDELNTGMMYVVPSALVMGLIMGTVEVLYLNRRFVRRSFIEKVFYKSFIYLASIVLFLATNSFFINSAKSGLPLSNAKVAAMTVDFIFSLESLAIIVFIGVVTITVLFIFELSENLGTNVTLSYLTGKYHRPKSENRIFMFLDMKSSTTIAEKLGHVRYFNLLKTYYAGMADAILFAQGEVYQYVGDEIIVSWPLKKGLKGAACLHCYFEIEASFEREAPKYESEFGIVPTFKAGMHVGQVTTGEIGELKKEILFTGDVLNTTSRIQGMCNELHAPFLISEELKQKISDPAFSFKPKGEVALRGRQEKVKLFSTERAQ